VGEASSFAAKELEFSYKAELLINMSQKKPANPPPLYKDTYASMTSKLLFPTWIYYSFPHILMVVITLNFSTHAYMALALLLAFFGKALLINSHVHMLVAPLQLAYIHFLHHYNLRILAKVAKNKRLQGIH
jgi:hypothetical protein